MNCRFTRNKIPLLFILFFINTLFAQEPEYTIFNTSINSSDEELGIIYLNNNRVLFASSKISNDEKSKRRSRRQLFLELYEGNIIENRDILETTKFRKNLGNIINEVDVAFSPDFKTMYYVLNNYYIIENKDKHQNYKTLHLFKSSINENYEVLKPVHLNFNSENYSIKHPHVSPDGKQLYFVSDMEDGFGGTDIYVVDILPNGSYSDPKNVGPNINTAQDEIFPFIDANYNLYYSSDSNKRFSNFDIYQSEFVNGEFQKPQALPEPINSDVDDFAFVINTGTQSGFFTSNRKGGKGGVDIYAFEIGEKQEEMFVLLGKIIKDKTLQPIDNVKISLSFDSKVIKNITTERDTFKFRLEPDKSYLLTIEKENFNSKEIAINTSESVDKTIIKTFALSPKICEQLIAGTVVDTETNLKLTQGRVQLFEDTKLIATQALNTDGTFSFEASCKKQYRIAVEAADYVSTETSIETSTVNGEKSSATISLSPKICEQLITGTVVDTETNLKLKTAIIHIFEGSTLVKAPWLINNGSFNFEGSCQKQYTIVVESIDYVTSKKMIETTTINGENASISIGLTPKICTQIITGTVVEAETNLQIQQGNLQVYEGNEIISNTALDSNGNFTFEGKCKKEYKFVVASKGYINNQKIIKIDTEHGKKLRTSIGLIREKCTQLISGSVFDARTKTKLNLARVQIFDGNELIATPKLNADATFSYQADCDKQYTIVARLNDYFKEEKFIKVSDQHGKKITTRIALMPEKCTQLISGSIVDARTKSQLKQARIQIFNGNSLLTSLELSDKATFNFEGNCNQQYKIVVSVPNYFKVEKNLALSAEHGESVPIGFSLTPKNCTQLVTGTVVEAITNKKLINAIVNIFDGTTLIASPKLTGNSTFSHEVTCNKKYRIEVSLKNYLPSETTINVSSESNANINKYISLNLEFISVRNLTMVKINPIQFDLNSEIISQEAAIEINKVVDVLRKYPAIKIDVNSHTDSRAPDAYNLALTTKRAQAITNYIVSKGIDLNRVKGTGFGETQLINECANGVRCSSAQHAENRRIEFVVIK